MLKSTLVSMMVGVVLSSLTSLAGSDSSELQAFKKKALSLNEVMLKGGEVSKDLHDQIKKQIERLDDQEYKKNQKSITSSFDALSKMTSEQRKRFIEVTGVLMQKVLPFQAPTSKR